jgi:DNA-binding NtrC family response regulator
VLSQSKFVLLYSFLRVLNEQPKVTFKTLFESLTSGWEPKKTFVTRFAYFVEACYLLRKFKKLGITHVHAHFGTNSTAVTLLVKLLGGPNYSFTCHGPEEFDRTDTLGLGKKIHHSSFAVAISNFGRSQLYRWADSTDWDKIQVVRCGVDETFLKSPLTNVPNNRRMICVGRLSEQKGQLTLIEAAAIVARKHPDFQLHLIGDGPMRPEIEKSIARLNLSGIVQLRGWKSGHEIRDLLQTSRAMVLPSFAEGLPVVIMESLALGRPVISTSVMGISDLVVTGKTGWLVPPAAPSDLAEAIIECLAAKPSRLNQMGAAGRALVAQRHNAQHEAERLMELIGVPTKWLGRSPAMEANFDLIREIAPTMATVLITGEKGSGKKRAVNALHAFSLRSDKPLITVECSHRVVEELEAEIFGCEQGAIPRSPVGRKGALEQAKGGTLFLREVGDLDLNLQYKILRLLNEKFYLRIGGDERLSSDVRIVMSTSRNLDEMAALGKFDPDLLMMISLVPVVVPPLRSHMEDLPILVNDFLKKLAIEHAKPPRVLSQEAMNALESYDWPKNILELRFVLEHAVLLGTGQEIQLADLPVPVRRLKKMEDPSSKSLQTKKPAVELGKSSKYEIVA